MCAVLFCSSATPIPYLCKLLSARRLAANTGMEHGAAQPERKSTRTKEARHILGFVRLNLALLPSFPPCLRAQLHYYSVMNTSLSQLQRSRVLRVGRRAGPVEVSAVHSWGTPQPDPFDRHSSERDKQAAPWQRANVRKGGAFNSPQRRRGRSAMLRSPDDSPLRDGNRDR